MSCRKARHETAELLDFRDRLRADPGLVAKYVAAKRAVLDAGVRDGVDYAERKASSLPHWATKAAKMPDVVRPVC